MEIPVTLKVKEIKGKDRFLLSYKNTNGEWVDSMFSVSKLDTKGKPYFSTVIDTEREPWKPNADIGTYNKIGKEADKEKFSDDINQVNKSICANDDFPF